MQMEQRSERAGLLAALAAPLLLWAVRASWLWVLVGGAAAGGFYLLLCRLQPLQDLAHVTRTVIGPGAARVLLWAQAVGLALAGGWLLRQADAIVPNLTRGFPWITIPLLCLAMAAVWRGPKAARATCAVLVWLPAVTAAVIVLAALPQLHGAWLRPTRRPMQLVGAFAVFLFPVVSRYTSSEKAGSGKWILAAVAAAALLALVTAGCLSPRQAATEPLPFFALAASSLLLGQAARFDAVLSTAVAAALYCALATLGSFTHCLTKKKSAAAIFTFYALLFLAACLVQVIPIGAVVLYLVVFWGIIPICMIVLEKAKKGENSRKRY